mgnify:CR=1 FL=1
MSNNGKRVAWVTGGGSGIGESGAEFLAADGWIVVVSGRRKDALDKLTGKAQYAGDFLPAGLLHAKVLRPPARWGRPSTSVSASVAASASVSGWAREQCSGRWA